MNEDNATRSGTDTSARAEGALVAKAPREGRLGRVDPHIHTMASDGLASVEQILDHVERHTDFDVIAISDHERVDAALAARAMARARGSRVEVIVGEEVTTRGGHVLALFLRERVRPLQSLRASLIQIHEQGGLAVAAHPLAPYPNCVSGRTIRRLQVDPDPRVHFDALEAFNPTSPGKTHHRQVVALAAELGMATTGGSDAHLLEAIGTGYTTFPGHTAEDFRRAILEHQTAWHGEYWTFLFQVRMYGHQLRKYSRDIRDDLLGALLRRGTGRYLGYPGGNLRPPRFSGAAEDRTAAADRQASP
ncbi:MAG: PHP-associated domain-containing protein [Candidatus Limnocylindrales bacterium]